MMDKVNWVNWAQTLQQKKLTGLAIAILEGTGPLKIFFSQVMMGFLPFFGQYHNNSWFSFAEMLENPGECKSFTAYLLEEKSR